MGSFIADEKKETDHLLALEGANESTLKLFQIDLLDYNSILIAVKGTLGIFHVASPNIICEVQDPEVPIYLDFCMECLLSSVT